MTEPTADVVCVDESLRKTYFLVVNCYPDDPAHGAGYVFARDAGTDEPARNVLATNDTLRTLWCAPTGSVWLTSTTGLVWTTADVPWPHDVVETGLEFDAPEGDLVWRHGALPLQTHNGARPNATAIWGFSDHDVYVGTFAGVIYHWDGGTWSQYASGLNGSIGTIRGRDPTDVYAVGYNGTILHYDGTRWSALADPDGADPRDTFTGIAFTEESDVLICGMSRGGRLLQGDANGLRVVGRYGAPLIGMVRLDGRLICAAKTSGVIELTPDGPVTLRADLVPWSVSAGAGRLYFTETPGKPAYSELHLATGVWRRLSY